MLIACATDRTYLEMVGVLIRSVALAHARTDCTFLVYGSGLSQQDRRSLEACAAGSMRLSIVDLTAEQRQALRSLKTARYITETAYALLLIPDLVDRSHARLLCLDCDMVVQRSLAPFYGIDLGGRLLAAAPIQTDPAYMARANSEIGRPASIPYFNSGTLLIDLDRWRDGDVGRRAMEYARTRALPIHHHDQAVLNRVVGEDWLPVSNAWNFGVDGSGEAECRSASILHYKGRRKPFHTDFDNPFALRAYERFRAETPFRDTPRLTPFRRSLDKRLRTIRNAFGS